MTQDIREWLSAGMRFAVDNAVRAFVSRTGCSHGLRVVAPDVPSLQIESRYAARVALLHGAMVVGTEKYGALPVVIDPAAGAGVRIDAKGNGKDA